MEPTDESEKEARTIHGSSRMAGEFVLNFGPTGSEKRYLMTSYNGNVYAATNPATSVKLAVPATIFPITSMTGDHGGRTASAQYFE